MLSFKIVLFYKWLEIYYEIVIKYLIKLIYEILICFHYKNEIKIKFMLDYPAMK